MTDCLSELPTRGRGSDARYSMVRDVHGAGTCAQESDEQQLECKPGHASFPPCVSLASAHAAPTYRSTVGDRRACMQIAHPVLPLPVAA